MIKIILVIFLTIATSFSVVAQTSRPLNEVSIVALIITSGQETPVSANIARTLESLDAQTLTAVGPNASELRSILKRFAAAAIDTDVALVYFDGAVLKTGDREFVAPGGIELGRPSDLLTQAIPISALARASALAANGGAVLVHSSGQGTALIDGVTLAEQAPAPRTGTSPILFAGPDAAHRLAEGLDAIAGSEGDIDLNEALGQLAGLDGISISQLPTRAAPLRHITVPEPEVAVEITDTTEALPAPGDDSATPADTIANLPQIGADEPAEPATEDVQEAAAPEAPDTASGENEAAQDAAAPANETQASSGDIELPMDVLRAMQSSLTRAQKRNIQRHLRSLHFYNGLIDGIFGRQSASAISAYQESIGAKVTGVLTPIQLDAMSE